MLLSGQYRFEQRQVFWCSTGERPSISHPVPILVYRLPAVNSIWWYAASPVWKPQRKTHQCYAGKLNGRPFTQPKNFTHLSQPCRLHTGDIGSCYQSALQRLRFHDHSELGIAMCHTCWIAKIFPPSTVPRRRRWLRGYQYRRLYFTVIHFGDFVWDSCRS